VLAIVRVKVSVIVRVSCCWHVLAVSFMHRCKKTFFYVFYFGHVFYVFNLFLFSKRFFHLKNVGKVHGDKQINKKHFQNNNNEIDL